MGQDSGLRRSDSEHLRRQILDLVADYYTAAHARSPFIPGQTRVHYAGRVYDEQELMAAVDACLDFWLTTGPRTEMFERRLAKCVVWATPWRSTLAHRPTWSPSRLSVPVAWSGRCGQGTR